MTTLLPLPAMPQMAVHVRNNGPSRRASDSSRALRAIATAAFCSSVSFAYSLRRDSVLSQSSILGNARRGGGRALKRARYETDLKKDGG